MPTYVYACDTCGAQFEQFQSFKDEPIKICPSCGSPVRRVFQPVGIVFKGSGWYITDSRKSSSATVGTDDSNATASTKNDTKTDSTTPATTTATSDSSPKSDTASTASTSASTTKTE